MIRVLVLPLAVACKTDRGVAPQARDLQTAQLTYDAGIVAVGDRETVPVFLESMGSGKVTVFDVYVDDDVHWQVSEAWKTWDEEAGEPADDQMTIPGGSRNDPEYGPLEIVFKPDAEAEFRTTLTILSNDTKVTEQNDEGQSIWRVVLRGIGKYPCGTVYPTFYDFGRNAAGGTFYMDGVFANCGPVKLTVSAYDKEGDTSFYLETDMPLYVLPGKSEGIRIAYQPAGGAPPESAVFTFLTNDPEFAESIELVGNSCEDSIDSSWDADGDGWLYADGSSCGGDCDDRDDDINPSSPETGGNGEDEDCDGTSDEAANDPSTDGDGDSYSEEEGDCDDADSSVGPDATETLNHIDDDCDGIIDEGSDWYDDDGDGLAEREGDCDDGNADIHPGADEAKDGVDEDCDGIIDEGTYDYDDDGDGFAELDDAGNDCDDADPWSYPGGFEDCDAKDNDCDGLTDEGEDDEENGACAFEVERATTTTETGCATTGRRVVPALALLGLLVVGLRRRRR